MLLVIGTLISPVENGVNMGMMRAQSRLERGPVNPRVSSILPNVVCSTSFVCLTEPFLEPQVHAPMTYIVLKFVPEFLFDLFTADGTTRALISVFGGIFQVKVVYTADGR